MSETITIQQMAKSLEERERYHRNHNRSRYAWNIRVHDCDYSGYVDGFSPRKKWDDRWYDYRVKDSDIFFRACEDGLRMFMDSSDCNFFDGFAPEQPLYNLIKTYTFYTDGRSGGWLTLESFNDREVDPDVNWYELVEEDPDWVQLVYHACLEVDKFDATAEVEQGIADRRWQMEESWETEEEEEQQHKDDAELLGTWFWFASANISDRIKAAAARLGYPMLPDGSTESQDKYNGQT